MEEAGDHEGARQEGVQLGFPILVGFSFLFQEEEDGRRERERKEGGVPLPLVQFGFPSGGATLWAAISYSLMAH